MDRAEKEQIVEELSERLKGTDSLIVADYRGLTNAQLAGVRAKLREHGATLTVVKNTLTRRAAEAAGADSLLALLEGPTAIAFVEADGDPAAVAKALADAAKETKILTLRGGILSGAAMGAADVEELAKVPPVDVLKSQLVGVIVAPLTQLLGLVQAPLRDLVGLIDARVEQLGGANADSAADSAEAESASPTLPETDTDLALDVAEASEGQEAEAAIESGSETGGDAADDSDAETVDEEENPD